ncbi:MAG: hypothetical protein HZA50_15395 [Planctomycetes bacterium]|nr:hypothetical protein [Planctomycetota bacterium]
MKNAQHEKRLKKLLAEAGKCHPPSPVSGLQLLRTIIEGVLQTETTPRHSSRAIVAIEKEFVDFNELRSAASRDMVECVGRDFPLGREKAEMITRALTRVFEKASDVSADYMLKMTRKELQQHLDEIGLSPFAAAYVMLEGFGGHAVPVDPALAECLEIDQCIRPGMEIGQVQSMLERLTPPKGARAVHRLMRDFVEKSAKPLQKKRAEAAARAAQLASQQAARQEKAAAKARQQEQAKIQEQAQAKAPEQAKSKQPEQARPAAKSAEKPGQAKPAKAAQPTVKPIQKQASPKPPPGPQHKPAAWKHQKKENKAVKKAAGLEKRKK